MHLASRLPDRSRSNPKTMSHVFVLSSDRQPLDPCHPARARKLLTSGRAAVWRRFPFTIILKDRCAAERVTHAHRVKLDPGSRTSVGRVAIRFRPSFRLGARIDVHPKYLIRLQQADGYHYAMPGASPVA
jgi:hypothetical protein